MSTVPGDVPVNDEHFVDAVVLVLVDGGGDLAGVFPHFPTLDFFIEY